MWALRRASDPIKNRASSIGTSRLCCARPETASRCLDDREDVFESSHDLFGRCLPLKKYYRSTCMPYNCSTWKCNFSSQAGARSSGDDDLEDGFSELEMSARADVAQVRNSENENEEKLISGTEFSEDDVEDGGNKEEPSPDELGISHIEVGASDRRLKNRKAAPELFNALMAIPVRSVYTILDRWAEDRKDLSREELNLTILNFRKRRLYGRALQLFVWLERSKQLDFVEKDYASFIDLIAKVQGIQNAENYLEKIPESFRRESVYRTLLANCVAASNLKKAEEIFRKMRDLQFPISCFTCDHLLLLYRRFEKQKIANVLLLMEKENIKPSPFTYYILISAKGQANDLSGMHRIVQMMKNEGIEPDERTQSLIARYYISGGLTKKAEAIMKKMEKGNIEANQRTREALLSLYAALGKADEVRRLWKVCQSNLWVDECATAIGAWGKLKNIEEAEAVFKEALKKWKKSAAKCYYALLDVYVQHKMLAKGKDLVKQMEDSGCKISPSIWNKLVRLYVEAGEVGEADSVLQKLSEQYQKSPLFVTCMSIMEGYAKRGDVHNCEKMLHKMRLAGYVDSRQYEALAKAYLMAKVPAYGFTERMKGDNIAMSKALAGLSMHIEEFRNTGASDFLAEGVDSSCNASR